MTKPPFAGRVRWRQEEAHLASPTFGLVRRRLTGLRERDVAEVVGTLERAGVWCVLIGGWAVDALLGGRTRHHEDLDLAVDDGTGAELTRADAALRAVGFGRVRRDVVPAARFSERTLYEDGRGRLVDLHPVVIAGRVDRTGPPAATPPATGQAPSPLPSLELPSLELVALELARVGGRKLRCLSAAEQLAVRREYQERVVDHQDIVRLERLLAP